MARSAARVQSNPESLKGRHASRSILQPTKRSIGTEKGFSSRAEKTVRRKIAKMPKLEDCANATSSCEKFRTEQRNGFCGPSDFPSAYPRKKPQPIMDRLSNASKEYLLLKMESEFQQLRTVNSRMIWLQKQMKSDMYVDVIAEIVRIHGLSMSGHVLIDEEREFLLQIFESCRQMKSFQLPKNFEVLFDKINKEKPPAIEEIGYQGTMTTNRIKQFVRIAKACSSSSLTLESNEFDVISLRTLVKEIILLKDQIIDSGKEFKLQLSRNRNIGQEGCKYLAKIPPIFAPVPVILSIHICELDDTCLQTFKDTFKAEQKGQDIKLKALDISGNPRLTEEGFKIFGEIIQLSKASHVIMQNCGINGKKLEEFNGIDNLEISNLDLSRNSTLSIGDGIRQVDLSVEKYKVQELRLADCAFESLEHLTRKVTSLDVSCNPCLEDVDRVASLATDEFIARDCSLCREDLKGILSSLKEEMGTPETRRRLVTLDLSDIDKCADKSLFSFMIKDFGNLTQKLVMHLSQPQNLIGLENNFNKEIQGVTEVEISPSVTLAFGAGSTQTKTKNKTKRNSIRQHRQVNKEKMDSAMMI